jgi:hypothetical protein
MQQLMAIVRELTQPREQRGSVESKELALPRFNPEVVGADSTAWCATVSLFMVGRPVQDSELFFTLCRALEGTAADWLTQIPVVGGFTWSRFKEFFLARFGGKETATSALMKMFNESSPKDETTGAYGIRLRSLLEARWKNLTMAEVWLFRLTSYDQRIERIALTSDIKIQDQFLSETNAFSYAKKKQAPSSDDLSAGPETKRRRPSELRIRCYQCRGSIDIEERSATRE